MGKLTKATHNMAQEQFNLNWHTYSDHLKEMMQNLMQSNESTDVTLLCEDKTRFKAHKFVLKACSPVFQSIINDLPQNEGSVVYLRGVFAPEMKSILQFMYLGRATFYPDRMNEFINIAKSLEIKEISKDVKSELEDISQVHDNSDLIQSIHENTNKSEIKVHEGKLIMEEDKFSETTKITSKHSSGQYPCNKCDKLFVQKKSLNRHTMIAHEGIRYSCKKCNKTYGQNFDLVRHIQAIHDGVKFQCDLCDTEFSQLNNLQ